jgi:hypothetical protein
MEHVLSVVNHAQKVTECKDVLEWSTHILQMHSFLFCVCH